MTKATPNNKWVSPDLVIPAKAGTSRDAERSSFCSVRAAWSVRLPQTWQRRVDGHSPGNYSERCRSLCAAAEANLLGRTVRGGENWGQALNASITETCRTIAGSGIASGMPGQRAASPVIRIRPIRRRQRRAMRAKWRVLSVIRMTAASSVFRGERPSLPTDRYLPITKPPRSRRTPHLTRVAILGGVVQKKRHSVESRKRGMRE